MPKFIVDPIAEAYFELLNFSVNGMENYPDIDQVLSESEPISHRDQQVLNECKSEVSTLIRYIEELSVPHLQEKINALSPEYSMSVKKYLHSNIIKCLANIK